MRAAPRSPRRPRGAALVMVLWATALLVVLASTLAFEGRTEAVLGRGEAQRAEAGALADAGVRRGILALLSTERRERWRVDGHPYRLVFAGGEVRIAVEAEHGKVDLNAAPEALVRGLVEALALDAGRPGIARPMADALLERRGADPAPGTGLGTDDRIRTRRDPQAFLSLADLGDLPGMDEALERRLREVTTVHTASPFLDPVSAPRLALLAVPGLAAGAVDAFLDAREDWVEREATQAVPQALPVAALAGGESFLARARSPVYTVTALGRTSAGTGAERRAVVRITGNVRRPFVVLAWSASGPPPAPQASPG